jgi:hypothetical protein
MTIWVVTLCKAWSERNGPLYPMGKVQIDSADRTEPEQAAQLARHRISIAPRIEES